MGGTDIVCRLHHLVNTRRTAFTSMVDSDPRPARPGQPDATSCYESLEKVTVVTSKRREELSTVNPVNLVIPDSLSFLS